MDEDHKSPQPDVDLIQGASLNAQQPVARGYWLLATIALLGFATLLLVRGPLTNPMPAGDFVHFYGAARAWVHGLNPYDGDTLHRVVDEAPGAPGAGERQPQLFALYPPATYPLISPFGVLAYPPAALVWTLINLALVPVLIGLTARLAGVPVRSFAGLLIAVGVLALAPLQTSFRLGQMAVLVVTLVMAALVLLQARRPGWSGLMLGLATAMKPQIGAVFLAYTLARRQWSAAGTAIAIVLACQAVGIAMLAAHGHDWWANLRETLHIFQYGGPGDPTPANPDAWQLINLQQPLHLFITSRSLVNALVWSSVLVVALLGWRWATIHRSASRELLALALLAVLSLLVAYHRVYDAVLLVIPVAWLVRWGFEQRWAGWVTLALLLPFVVSGPAALNQAQLRSWIPEPLADSGVWRLLLMPHHTWALLGLAIVFAYLLATRRQPTSQ